MWVNLLDFLPGLDSRLEFLLLVGIFDLVADDENDLADKLALDKPVEYELGVRAKSLLLLLLLIRVLFS